MADWTDIADSVLEVGKPIRSIDHFALRDNVVAAFEKATGAPVLANNYIVAAMIAADAVTTAKLLNSNVTTAKIADANVTAAKLATTSSEDAWVGARNVALGLAGIGTYAFLKHSSSSVSAGSSHAGASLEYTGTDGTSGGTPAGTWRAHGAAGTGEGTVFIRTA